MTKNILKILKWDKKTRNYLIDMGMLISASLVFITGIIKFPSIIASHEFFLKNSIGLLILHDWSGIILEFFVFLHVLLHMKWIIGRTKNSFRRLKLKKVLKSISLLIIIISLIVPINKYLMNLEESSSYIYRKKERIQIVGIGWPEYNSKEILSVRPDLFKEGQFSIFDILVYLDNKNEINMDYYFDEEMDTHVINSINGEKNLWYSAYYDGGWYEDNVFRIDHYPYKPGMEIKINHARRGFLDPLFNSFRREVARLNNNNGTVIIPNVRIKSPHNNLNFQNVTVTAHNLRNDTLHEGVITAVDVIMSLGDLGLLTYKLNWYETIGRAKVKNYYVDGINNDIAYARCGFVYEAGDLRYSGFKGNHIHIPSDIRIINSPEYEEWFWICL